MKTNSTGNRTVALLRIDWCGCFQVPMIELISIGQSSESVPLKKLWFKDRNDFKFDYENGMDDKWMSIIKKKCFPIGHCECERDTNSILCHYWGNWWKLLSRPKCRTCHRTWINETPKTIKANAPEASRISLSIETNGIIIEIPVWM